MNRSQQIQQLKTINHWDIIIIGGGATGLGAAVDSAARGYKTLLLEQHDFGKGTSSRSTKLIHGGVRYLQQGNFRLVRDALRERGLLLKNAPHIAHRLKLVLPAYRWWEKLYYGLGLKVYNFLSAKLSLGPSEILSIKKTQEYIKGLDGKKLSGGVAYYDGQFDDARLCMSLALTAADVGATVLNYCKVTNLIHENGKVAGVHIHDCLTDETFEARGTVVINATGVFVDEVLKMDDDGLTKTVSPSQGIHIVVDKTFFPGDQALFIPRTDDGRVLFAVPFHDKVIIGTTDTSVDTAVIEPLPLEEEVEFVINHFNRYVHTGLKRSDIKSVFAGLRPLVKVPGQKKTAVLPRDHTIWVSKGGMINISGGKWTTYRLMAKDTIDEADKLMGNPRDCKTADYVLAGGENYKAKSWQDIQAQYTLPEDIARHLVRKYGSRAHLVASLAREDVQLRERLSPAYPYIRAEVVHAVRNEMVVTPRDFLARRIRLEITDWDETLNSLPVVADLMARELGWTEAEKARYADAYASEIGKFIADAR